MIAGVPYAPVSQPYSLVAKDYGKLKTILDVLTPGLVYVNDGTGSRSRSLRACRRTSRSSPASIRRRNGPRRPSRRSSKAAGTRGRRGARQGRARHGREAPVHLRLDRIAQGRHQHPEDDDIEPGDAEGRQPELPHGRAGSGRLAAVEPHVRRQQQFQSRAVGRRLLLHRRGEAAARRDRSDGAQSQGRVADHLLQRAEGLRDAAALRGAGRGLAQRACSPTCRPSSTPGRR